MIPIAKVVVSPTEPQGKNRKKIWIQKGKNLFDKDNANIVSGVNINRNTNTITSDTNSKILYIKCLPNTSYVVSKQILSNNSRFAIAFSSEIPVIDTNLNGLVYDYTGKKLASTSDSDSKYLCVWYYNSGDTLTEQEILDIIQIEQGSTATDYEDYIEPAIYIKNKNNVYEKFM